MDLPAPTGPLTVSTRAQLRHYLGHSLPGRRHGWGHLAIRHNSVARSSPCRFCEGTATPQQGPALFWDSDPICPSCGMQIAPELTVYLSILQQALPDTP